MTHEGEIVPTLGRFIADSPSPGKVAAGAGLCRYYPLPSGPAPTPTSPVCLRERGWFVDALHLRADEELYHVLRDAFARSLTEGLFKSRHATPLQGASYLGSRFTATVLQPE
jgi:hypothetical protein